MHPCMDIRTGNSSNARLLIHSYPRVYDAVDRIARRFECAVSVAGLSLAGYGLTDQMRQGTKPDLLL
jgi:hypothetical protein